MNHPDNVGNWSPGFLAHRENTAIPPLTAAWVNQHLRVGERVVATHTFQGGIAALVRKLTVRNPDGYARNLVLRSYVDSSVLHEAEGRLINEARALTLLTGTTVSALRLITLDATVTTCEYPSVLMTHVSGRTVLFDAGLEERILLLASQIVAIHAIYPSKRPPDFRNLTTADTVVVPATDDRSVWAAGIDILHRPVPTFDGRTLHRDFQPGNVLFGVPSSTATPTRLTGVVDWDGFCWGPIDLDVAHCATIWRCCTVRSGVCDLPQPTRMRAAGWPRQIARGNTGRYERCCPVRKKCSCGRGHGVRQEDRTSLRMRWKSD